jgi:glutaredoxin
MVAALLLLFLSGTPLDDARKHLAAGKLDDVLFDLDGKTFAENDRPLAAAVLAEAARAGLEAKDLVLALQFAQMALRLDKKEPLALETGARASLLQKQFDPAEDYADRLMALNPKAGPPRLLRAEIALEEGEWAKVVSLCRDVDARQLSEADRQRLLSVVQSAMRELGERDAARSEAKTLQTQVEAQLKSAVATARQLPVRADAPKVIVYGTEWCGFCHQAAAWLTRRGVPFVVKDIEKDADALLELNEKKKAACKAQQGGVPWIDTGPELLTGFNVAALERLFPRQ